MSHRTLARPVALSAAAILGLSGTFAAAPAFASEEPKALSTKAFSAVREDLQAEENVEVVGRTVDGKLYLGTTGGVEAGTLPTVKELEKQVGGEIAIEQVSLKSPLSAYAKNDVVGGAGYLAYNAGKTGYGMCSIGFTGWSKSGQPALITAGHCTDDGKLKDPIRSIPSNDEAGGGPSGQAKPLDSAPIGPFSSYRYGGPGNGNPGADRDKASSDIATIDVKNTNLKIKPEVTDWTTSKGDDLSLSTTDVTAVGNPVEGKPVKRSGRTTGIRSDDSIDLAEGWARVSGRWVHGFGVNGLEARPGDSGGSIYQGTTAVGVVSGGGSGSDGRPFVWGTRLQDALKLTDGYKVALKVSAPRVATTGDLASGEAITGTAPAGSTVELTAEDGQVLEAKVGSDGTWSVEADGDLGTQEYAAVAKKGFDSSEASDFKINVTD